MPATTSKLFEFIKIRSTRTIDRYEIHSAAFSDLRYSLRSMIVSFHESGDWEANEISGHLRSILSKWLTVPVPFDDTVLLALKEMGEPDAVESRWGCDIRGYYEDACRSATVLMEVENPVRVKLTKLIREMQEKRQLFHIFCHKRSRKYFESLSNSSDIEDLPRNVFLHTVVDYREVDVFDVLLKVGPLRSRGWGAIPDAVLTTPRFDTLYQVLWSGCRDAPDFGYDPVSEQLSGHTNSPGESLNNYYKNPTLQLNWKVRESKSEDTTFGRYINVPDENDLDVLSGLAQSVDMHRSILVQLTDEYGILYPPFSRVLSFEGDPLTLGYRLPGETLTEGMFLILPVLNDTELTELKADEGYFSRIWKEKLQEEYQRDPEGLVNRLWDNGLLLLGLQSRVESWCIPATTVIPAPQLVKHFEILINVLGIEFETSVRKKRPQASWWRYAWDEVRRSRGAAIQSGFQEHRDLETQVETIAKSLDEEIRRNMHKPRFSIQIPQDNIIEINGTLLFLKVMAIESGFMVPPAELKMLKELDRIDQWRA